MPSNQTDPRREPGSISRLVAGAGNLLRKHWRPALFILAGVVAAGVWLRPLDKIATALSSTAHLAKEFSMGPGRLSGTSADATPLLRTDQMTALKQQLELVEHTFCSYRDGTKYPQESQPISEHPDQIYPNQPVTEANAMRTGSDKSDPSVQLNTSQSRVYVASGESVVFSVKAVDRDGKTLPLFVTRAVASAVTAQGSRIGAQVVLPFADDGNNGDAAAGDGTFSSLLAPGATGLANFSGTIRTEVQYNVGDRSGFVLFDIIYTSETPATWAGSIRETVEDGSLSLYLKADVRQAGRYLVSGRVDDATGKPFALVTFNDVIGLGPTEIKLTVFGKLMRDQQPAFPLTLRDVDAYLLKENADPDRALMPRLAGAVFTTKAYTLKGFSDAEWQGEQRSRYLAELGKDVSLAREALAQLDPEQVNRPFTQADCAKVAIAEKIDALSKEHRTGLNLGNTR